jgi:hypothetical protein
MCEKSGILRLKNVMMILKMKILYNLCVFYVLCSYCAKRHSLLLFQVQ